MDSTKEITPDDIMYEDDIIRILRPECKKGIVIWTHYTQPENVPSIIKTGLKTGKQLAAEGIDYGRIVKHPYIFFRAPFYSREIDYTSIKSEIESSYGCEAYDKPNRIYIRVDTEKTSVFSSEIRCKYRPNLAYGSPEFNELMEIELNKSQKTLSWYLKVIDENAKYVKKYDKSYFYNLHTSRVREFPIMKKCEYPYDENNVSMNSEILVALPHLTPDYFVYST